MIYHSTREKKGGVNAREALLKGLCEDGGLFVSDEVGSRPLAPADLEKLDYRSIAFEVFSRLLDDFTAEELKAGIDAAYGQTFASPAVTPVTRLGENWLLELYHGPTSAFKDMALCMLPQFMSAALKGKKERVMIVTATSGDTGKAALNGFKDVPGVGITVFYPHEKVSDIQYLQMATQEGKNVNVAAVEGNFDDVQSAVKRLFASDFAKESAQNGVKLSSANSINIGRLVPQVVYYFDAYRQLMKTGTIKAGDLVDFTVPTGNFGDVLAGYYAKKMGLPVGRFVVASNANNVLTDFLTTGIYDRNRPFIKTITPSMDILISSNLERMLYDMADGDTDLIARLMTDLKEKGIFKVEGDMLERIRAVFTCGFADDAETSVSIRDAWNKEKRLIDPHTAVARKVALEKKREGVPMVVLSTASPYKFCRDVYEAIAETKADRHDWDGFRYMDELVKLTGELAPEALATLRQKPLLHKDVVTVDGMTAVVKNAAQREF